MSKGVSHKADPLLFKNNLPTLSVVLGLTYEAVTTLLVV